MLFSLSKIFPQLCFSSVKMCNKKECSLSSLDKIPHSNFPLINKESIKITADLQYIVTILHFENKPII